MNHIRQPAVAGMFYPADKQSLKDEIHQYLNQVHDSHDTNGEQVIAPKAIVVPHAGYIYSAPIAASAYKQIIPLKDKINRVVLLGPSHRVGFRGLAVPEADVFNTPLGNIPIDQKGIQLLAGLTHVMNIVLKFSYLFYKKFLVSFLLYLWWWVMLNVMKLQK